MRKIITQLSIFPSLLWL